MADAVLHAVIVEAGEGADADAEAEAAALRTAAARFPIVVVDAVMDAIPPGEPRVVTTEPLFVYTHPRGTEPLIRLPLVVSYANDHIRLTAEWDDTSWVFPFTWKDLAEAPLRPGWEIRQETTISPYIEASTPYMVFKAEALSALIAFHPNAIRALALGLTTFASTK